MTRREFGKWLLGGVAATVALSSTTVEAAQRVLGVTGEFDPEKLLWIPGEAKIVLPPEKLIIEPVKAGVGVYRLTNRLGTFWFDRDGVLVDSLDTKGRPVAVLDGEEAPNLEGVRRLIRGDSYEWRGDTAKVSYGGYTYRDFNGRTYEGTQRRALGSGGTLTRWPGLIPSKPERDFVARLRLEM